MQAPQAPQQPPYLQGLVDVGTGNSRIRFSVYGSTVVDLEFTADVAAAGDVQAVCRRVGATFLAETRRIGYKHIAMELTFESAALRQAQRKSCTPLQAALEQCTIFLWDPEQQFQCPVPCPQCVRIAQQHAQQRDAQGRPLYPQPATSAARDGYSITAREARSPLRSVFIVSAKRKCSKRE